MTEKRFKLIEYLPNVIQIKDNNQKLNSHEIVDLLNELHEEKEFWKSDACKETNENNILWNEIFIMIEQGGKPSEAFEDYMITKKRGIVNCRFA